MNAEGKLAIYQAADGAIELPIDAKLEAIWACYQRPQAAINTRSGVIDVERG